MNDILKQVTEHLQNPKARIVAMVGQAGCKAPVFSPADLPKMKADGNGLRIGRLYIFACQIRFARVA